MRAAVFAFALAACQTSATPSAKLELVDAPPEGPVAPIVRAELARARAAHKTLMVYVGATWCEPCERFHHAAETGALDAQFGALRLLVFDYDRDDTRLVGAGYESEMIPLFVLPREDGRSSGRQIEGGVKGEAAVEDIAGRLRSLM
jgi:hypothetical protein